MFSPTNFWHAEFPVDNWIKYFFKSTKYLQDKEVYWKSENLLFGTFSTVKFYGGGRIQFISTTTYILYCMKKWNFGIWQEEFFILRFVWWLLCAINLYRFFSWNTVARGWHNMYLCVYKCEGKKEAPSINSSMTARKNFFISWKEKIYLIAFQYKFHRLTTYGCNTHTYISFLSSFWKILSSEKRASDESCHEFDDDRSI